MYLLAAKFLGGFLFLCGIFYAGWHEASIIKDAELSDYKAQVAQAQSAQATANAQLIVNQTKATLQSEKDHEKAISSIHTYYANLLRQRSKASGQSVPSLPKSPRKLDEVPTQCFPLAASSAQDVQQLIDLQNWIRQQQSLNPPSQ